MSQATTPAVSPAPVEESTPVAPPTSPTAARLSFKEGFFRFSERFGHMMSRVLLTLLYILLVAPVGIFLSLFGDRLDIRRYRGTSWNSWGHTNDTLDAARRQD